MGIAALNAILQKPPALASAAGAAGGAGGAERRGTALGGGGGAAGVAGAAQRRATALVDGADVGVAVAHDAADFLVAPAFPLADRVLAVPGLVGAPVEPGQAQLVVVGHVQV